MRNQESDSLRDTLSLRVGSWACPIRNLSLSVLVRSMEALNPRRGAPSRGTPVGGARGGIVAVETLTPL